MSKPKLKDRVPPTVLLKLLELMCKQTILTKHLSAQHTIPISLYLVFFKAITLNLRSLSPSNLTSLVSSSIPSPNHFSALDVKAATDTLCSTLTSCLDHICPLSSRPARAAPSNSWLSDVLREHRSELRAAERKWRKSKDPSDLSIYQSLLSYFSAEVHTAKASYFHNKINSTPDTRNLFKTFKSLLCPPPPPTPTTSLTADDFATFFTNKTSSISSQFSAPHKQDLKPTTSTDKTPLFSFCPLTDAKYWNYCNALLDGLPSCTIKPLQMIQNAALRLVFSRPKRAHVTPLFDSLHWLRVAARIKFKTLMLVFRTATGSAPSYFHSLMTIYIPSRSLRSASERRFMVPSQRGSKSLSRMFSFTVPGCWNELPTPIRNAESLTIFKWHLKTHLFRLYLTSASSSS